jgi:hypothetical protein
MGSQFVDLIAKLASKSEFAGEITRSSEGHTPPAIGFYRTGLTPPTRDGQPQ